MRFFLHGAHVPHRKNTADMAPVRMDPPAVITLPLSMHIGKSAIPVVKVGDEVFVGTLVAKEDGFVSSAVYSSVSGKVKSVSDITSNSGAIVKAIKIESDGNMTSDPGIAPPAVTTKEEFLEAVKSSGIVGLGGAGFPSHVKLTVPADKSADVLIINGAECEPYITSDTRTMIDRVDDIRFGIENILKYVGVSKVIIAIEENKASAIESMRAMAKEMENVEVYVLPSLYPQGAEKVIVYHTTGRVVAAGKLPIDVGAIVINCTTVAAIGNYIKTGMPLVRKCVTVDGGAFRSAMNISVPIGTPISAVVDFVGGFKETPHTVLLGGPMMGTSVVDFELPILKNTNALLALTEVDARRKKETACIHCGACANHCPLNLNPAAFMKAYRLDNSEELKRLRADICMECGCCSYVCPAAKPLVETNKLAKAKLRTYLAEQKKKEEEKEGKQNG